MAAEVGESDSILLHFAFRKAPMSKVNTWKRWKRPLRDPFDARDLAALPMTLVNGSRRGKEGEPSRWRRLSHNASTIRCTVCSTCTSTARTFRILCCSPITSSHVDEFCARARALMYGNEDYNAGRAWQLHYAAWRKWPGDE